MIIYCLKLLTVNNNYLPLMEVFTVNKTFTVNTYYLPLMEKFIVNDYYLLLINLKNDMENY